jgi:hypothetical protein
MGGKKWFCKNMGLRKKEMDNDFLIDLAKKYQLL